MEMGGTRRSSVQSVGGTKSNGRRTRTVIHAEGQANASRPDCQGIFPAASRQRWSPGTIAQALRLGSPFARAAKQFNFRLSKNSLQQGVWRAAGRKASDSSKEEEVVWRETVAPASEVMNISMDGAMVNIRGDGKR